eukprot:GHVN01050514.1.p1 GENE.GHVN01050514.1~~GHVN01050514.1.p1  ORF type:complete len:121 (+),score=4.37 GHVN01050514.1:314-676(+)
MRDDSISGEGASYNPKIFNPPDTNHLDDLTSDVYQTIRSIRDPEFPAQDLESLGIVHPDCIAITSTSPQQRISSSIGEQTEIKINIKPTTPHCSLAATIGLCIRTKLAREFDTGRYAPKI